MDMVSLAYVDNLADLIRGGRVPEPVLDEAVRRILRIKFLTGLFDNPYVDPGRSDQVMLLPEHRAAARTFAQESTVLLKNQGGLLPFNEDIRTIAVYGPLAQAQAELFGAWTLDGVGKDVTSIAEAIREAAPADVKVFELGSYARPGDLWLAGIGCFGHRGGRAPGAQRRGQQHLNPRTACRAARTDRRGA